MRRDVDVVQMELLGRIGLLLSHRALIMRFKQRCERFEADTLRTAVERLGPQARREDYLTQKCARALFEEGLNPLFNAAIVRLRPDLFDPGAGWTLYVEAKQYSTLATLRANLKKASWQVWSTWSELEGARSGLGILGEVGDGPHDRPPLGRQLREGEEVEVEVRSLLPAVALRLGRGQQDEHGTSGIGWAGRVGRRGRAAPARTH
jgi:hypothetical protein